MKTKNSEPNRVGRLGEVVARKALNLAAEQTNLQAIQQKTAGLDGRKKAHARREQQRLREPKSRISQLGAELA